MHADHSVPSRLLAMFSPLHKTAFGLAVGLVAGLATAAVTAFHVMVEPVRAPDLALLNQYFYGYTVSWEGTVVGFLWALFAGFVAGWFCAFVRNLAIAVWIFVVRIRAGLSQAADFLSHL